jgi:GNAT superfamily N-acetyltransferase
MYPPHALNAPPGRATNEADCPENFRLRAGLASASYTARGDAGSKTVWRIVFVVDMEPPKPGFERRLWAAVGTSIAHRGAVPADAMLTPMASTTTPEFALPNGLWGDLQCHYVYYADGPTQEQLTAALAVALARNDLEAGLLLLDGHDGIKAGVAALMAMREHPLWRDHAGEMLAELEREVGREVARRAPVPLPPDLGDRIRAAITGLPDYAMDDVLEISTGPITTWVNYVSRRYSPRYDGTNGPWDRDTQYMFELVQGSGLLVWLSANTVKEFQGRGMGTRFFKACERMAFEAGYRRFSVLGPNNGPYWRDRMGYACFPTGILTHLEAYKELSARP